MTKYTTFIPEGVEGIPNWADCGEGTGIFGYQIYFNHTLVPGVMFSSPEAAASTDRSVVALKLAMDNAIINYNSDEDIEIEMLV
jgi:hypothetical protein